MKLRLEKKKKKKRGAEVRGKVVYVDKFHFFATPTSILIGNKLVFPSQIYFPHEVGGE